MRTATVNVTERMFACDGPLLIFGKHCRLLAVFRYWVFAVHKTLSHVAQTTQLRYHIHALEGYSPLLQFSYRFLDWSTNAMVDVLQPL